jgi:hypothetical protein
VQIVKALIDKATQVKEKGKELAEKFHSLEKVVQEACNTSMAWDNLCVIFGGLLGAGLFLGERSIFGKDLFLERKT